MWESSNTPFQSARLTGSWDTDTSGFVEVAVARTECSVVGTYVALMLVVSKVFLPGVLFGVKFQILGGVMRMKEEHLKEWLPNVKHREQEDGGVEGLGDR
jgi:hypothetical protein